MCGCSSADAIEQWGGSDGWTCKACHDAEHEREKAEALAAMPEEHKPWHYEGKDEITCPYCAYEFSDSWEHANANETEHYC